MKKHLLFILGAVCILGSSSCVKDALIGPGPKKPASSPPAKPVDTAKKADTVANGAYVKMMLQDIDSTHTDQILVEFSKYSTPAYSPAYDASTFFGPAPVVLSSVSSDGVLMDIYCLPYIPGEAIKLSAIFPQGEHMYKFVLNASSKMPPNKPSMILDTKDNTLHAMPYTFSANKNDATRFKLVVP